MLGANLPIANEKYVYFPQDPPVPGGFTNDPFDIDTVELCNDGIDNDGDFLIDEDCDRKSMQWLSCIYALSSFTNIKSYFSSPLNKISMQS